MKSQTFINVKINYNYSLFVLKYFINVEWNLNLYLIEGWKIFKDVIQQSK